MEKKNFYIGTRKYKAPIVGCLSSSSADAIRSRANKKMTVISTSINDYFLSFFFFLENYPKFIKL